MGHRGLAPPAHIREPAHNRERLRVKEVPTAHSDSYISPKSHSVQPPEHPNATSTRPPAWHDGGHLQLIHAGLVVAHGCDQDMTVDAGVK